GDVVASGEGEGYLRFKLGRVPEPVRQAFQDLAQYTTKWLNLVSDIKDALTEAIEKVHTDITRAVAEKWAPIVALTLLRFESVSGLFQAYAVKDEENAAPQARWFKLHGGFEADIELFASPILAGPLLNHYLWSRCHGAILTSATLTALGKFDRFRSHAGLSPQFNYQSLPSPFDYSSVAEIRVPKVACDPKEVDKHTQAVTDYVNQNWDLMLGTLVLFSSRKQLEEVFLRLDADVKSHVLAQNQMSKQELVRLHKKSVDAGEVSVIFGLASFAEGIDLPGEYCEHVVITRLPFAVPDQPLEAALAEWIESQGRNAFMEISVPDAAIRLTQACGRLIRNEQDKGIISVLDRRLVSSGYGRRILDSLPPFRRVIE
ncbi:MAG TPA: helicase C-terminal domain-containing protein, partial [Pseudomonadales bacterium]|nr:helicase C-terminal domain-containing protein [Pseudomonadales bacterium]